MSGLSGVNTLALNRATVKAAMQHYFDKVLFQEGASPSVVDVTYNTPAQMFEVRVGEHPA